MTLNEMAMTGLRAALIGRDVNIISGGCSGCTARITDVGMADLSEVNGEPKFCIEVQVFVPARGFNPWMMLENVRARGEAL